MKRWGEGTMWQGQGEDYYGEGQVAGKLRGLCERLPKAKSLGHSEITDNSNNLWQSIVVEQLVLSSTALQQFVLATGTGAPRLCSAPAQYVMHPWWLRTKLTSRLRSECMIFEVRLKLLGCYSGRKSDSAHDSAQRS